MNRYKKIIKNPKTRLAILKSLSFVPDRFMLAIQYLIKLGRWPNFKSPKRYTEKLQVYKMQHRDPLMGICVDKYDVREYVSKVGLSSILNDCYGIFNTAEDINFEKLPNKFVAKTTDGTGGNNVYICKDKSTEDIGKIRQLLNSWLGVKDYNAGREWPYTQIKRSRIIVEKLIESDNTEGDLPDYKFFCFNGEVFCSYMTKGYSLDHLSAQMGFFDRDFNLLNVTRTDYLPIRNQPDKPKNYELMVNYAELLSKPFPHVRVDFYNVGGKIIFGELTFFTASGYMQFIPDTFDLEMGKAFINYRN